jgi:hypothetical protein
MNMYLQKRSFMKTFPSFQDKARVYISITQERKCVYIGRAELLSDTSSVNVKNGMSMDSLGVGEKAT